MTITVKGFIIFIIIASVSIYAFTIETELARFKRQDVFYNESFKPMSKEKACAILKLKAFQSESFVENTIFRKCYSYD